VPGNAVVPGVLGFLVVAGMSLALYFLFRSMNKQLRKVTPLPPASSGPASSGPASSGPASSGTAQAAARPGPDGAAPVRPGQDAGGGQVSPG
jgi:hypothetical protein